MLLQLPQGVAAGIHGGVVGVIRVGLAVALARNFKAIRLGLVPAQNGLHDAVQLRQRSALCHDQAPPDGRGCALQLHMQLVSTTGHRRRHENTPSRSKKPPFKSSHAHAAGAWARKSATRVGMAARAYAESAALVKASAKNASAGRLRVAIKLCRAASTIAGAPQAYTSKGARSAKSSSTAWCTHPVRPCQLSSGNASETTGTKFKPPGRRCA